MRNSLLSARDVWAALLAVVCLCVGGTARAEPERTTSKPKLILDCDTANKSEFNVRRDLNAADFLLNCEPLELHIMTATVSGALKFDRDESFRRQAQMGKLGVYLTERWKARFPDAKTWIMWDVALIEALIRPELAAEEQVTTPPENRQRKVWMYHKINADRMRADFWKAAMSVSAGEK